MAESKIKMQTPIICSFIEEEGSSYDDKPWKVLRAHWSEIPKRSLVMGTITCAGTRNYWGYKFNDSYGAFYIDMYIDAVPAYRVIVRNNVWKYADIKTGSFADVS